MRQELGAAGADPATVLAQVALDRAPASALHLARGVVALPAMREPVVTVRDAPTVTNTAAVLL